MANDAPLLLNPDGGNVGIGTTSPTNKLDVSGNLAIGTGSSLTTFEMRDIANASWKFSTIGSILRFMNDNGGSYSEKMVIRNTGNVGIGTTSPSYKLDVIGDIRATGDMLYGGTDGSANGSVYTKADYVFEKGYKPLSTTEVERFIRKKRHLPCMTSAKAEKKGLVNMTRMDFETVETVENLQIQIIDQNNVIKELKSENKKMKHLLLNFEERFKALENKYK